MELRRVLCVLTITALVSLCVSCDGDSDSTLDGVPTGSTAIGPEGGSLRSIDGKVLLTVPANALATIQNISISAASAADLPDGFELADGAQDMYLFEPEGITFLEPVTVEFTVDGPPSAGAESFSPNISFLTSIAGDGSSIEFLDEQDYSIDLGAGIATVTGTITHFSLIVSATSAAEGVSASVGGIPSSVSVGIEVFTATATASVAEGSSFSSTAVEYVNQAQAPLAVSASNSSRNFVLGSIDAANSPKSTSITYDCTAAGNPVFIMDLRFENPDIGSLLSMCIRRPINAQSDWLIPGKLLDYSITFIKQIACTDGSETTTTTTVPSPTTMVPAPTTTIPASSGTVSITSVCHQHIGPGNSVIRVTISTDKADGTVVTGTLNGPVGGAASAQVSNGAATLEFPINMYGQYSITVEDQTASHTVDESNTC